MNYSNFRNNLSAALDMVNENHNPILITRQSGKPAVVMSLDDFKSYEETAYLMASSRNIDRLNQSIEQLEKNQGMTHALIEE